MSQSIPCSMPYPYCPSHPIVPWNRLDRMGKSQSVPCRIPYPYCPPIPLYHGTDWTDRNVPKRPMQYACPSLPTVPWDGLDRMGTSQSVPCSIPYPYYPSHPTVPWDRLDRLGTCGVIVLLNKLYTMKSITGSLCNYYALLPGLSAPLNQIAPDL